MISVLIAADYCPMDRVAKLVEKGDYESIFGEVKPIIENCDYSIVNFECPVRTSQGGDIKKAGPSLKCSAKSVEALQYAGFNCATLANNHFYDQGEEGVHDTIDALSKAGISHVGGGYNLQDAGKILYQKVKDKTIAIINFCEHEWSIATETTGGSNPLNPIRQYYDIIEAKKNANYVIVIVHGGIEHFQYPSPRMVETYRFFVDAGADAIINHHQHCFSGGEVYHGKPIFYGLGNFCFDWQSRRTKLWDEGYMVRLTLDEGHVDTELIPYSQNDEMPGVHIYKGDKKKELVAKFREIAYVISQNSELIKLYDELKERTCRKYSIYLTPYSNRLLLALYMRHLLPLKMSRKRLRELLNMINCESHRDRLINMLNFYINK